VAILSDVADLGKAAADPASGTIAFTTTSAVAVGGFISVQVGWFDTAATLSSVSGGGLTWTIDKQGRPANPSSDNTALVSAQAPAGLASGTTITATFSGTTPVAREISGMSLTGVATSSPVDTTSGPTGVSPAAAGWTTPSMAIQAGSAIVATAYNETGNFTNTVTSPSVQAVLNPNSASPTSQVTCYRIESSAGSYTVAGAWSTAAQSGTIAVAYKAAAGGTTTATPALNPLLRMLQQGGLQKAKALLLIHPPVAVAAPVDQSVSLTGLSNPAQFGAISIIQDQFVSITGFQDAAQFGATAPAITVPITGFQDAAQFGALTVNQTVSVTGLQDSAQFGVLSVDQTVPIVGFQDAAQFGAVTPSTGTPVSITGFQDAAQFGVPSANQTVPVSGLLVSAQFGGPVPSQTVNLAGFSSAAQFGLVTIDRRSWSRRNDLEE
jgi:hypothetical protein